MTDGVGIPEQKPLSRRACLSLGRLSLMAVGSGIFASILGLRFSESEVGLGEDGASRTKQPEVNFGAGIKWNDL